MCALEHLGSLEDGLRFVERSLECLRPGGVAVHTTEFNLSSDEDTVTDGPTALYRKKDLVALTSRLEARGHRVAPLDFDAGEGVLDAYVDGPPWLPWAEKPHLRLDVGGYVATSFVFVVSAAGTSGTT